MFTPAKHIPNLGVTRVLLCGVPIVSLWVLCVFAELNAQGNQSPSSKDFFPAPHSNSSKNSSCQARFILDSTYNTGSGPHFIGIGDWNGDGKPDLAIPH
ncbi:MAG: FG-GAP repeat domain-containing protein, partial [Nitrososphaera sp.]